MHKKCVPKRLWDYGLRWTCDVMQRTSTEARSANGRSPLEIITGNTPDISEFLDFGFYDWCWYSDAFGMAETKLGLWLGVSHRVGSLMSYWLLTDKCKVIWRTTVQSITNLKMQEDMNKGWTQAFNLAIRERINDSAHYIIDGGKNEPKGWAMQLLDTDDDFQDEFNNVISHPEVKEADELFTLEVMGNTYINMELALPQGDTLESWYARVTKRLRDANGIPIGTAHDNPILDTRMYEVEFMDGEKSSLLANYIAENLFAQIDDNGNRQVLLNEIIDHRTMGRQVMQQDAFIMAKNGVRRRKETTTGWEILVQWKDGSTNWVALKDMKESYPIQVAEYAIASRISMEPAFAWWVPHVLKKRNQIISKVKSKYWLRTHKFGIRIPKTIEEACRLDREIGDNLWWEGICKEMKNVRPAFEVFEGKQHDIPPGFQQICCHMIFDVKIGENFRWKARFVAGGHTTETPASLTYSSIVSRNTVCIALTIAALNNLQVMSCDIQNMYLTATCHEKIWMYAGPEFGSEKGSIMLIREVLYGLNSSGAAF